MRLCHFAPEQLPRLKLNAKNADKNVRKQVGRKRVNMYNYMVFNVSDRKLYRDFLAYYKCNSCDELYHVSITNPKLLKYLEEFIARRMN